MDAFAKCDIQKGEELTIDYQCETNHTRMITKFYHTSNDFRENVKSLLKNNIISESKTDPQMSHQQSKGSSKKIATTSTETSFGDTIKDRTVRLKTSVRESNKKTNILKPSSNERKKTYERIMPSERCLIKSNKVNSKTAPDRSNVSLKDKLTPMHNIISHKQKDAIEETSPFL